MTGNERELLQLKKDEVKALNRANELKLTELKLIKLLIKSSLISNDKPIEPVTEIFHQLEDIIIR